MEVAVDISLYPLDQEFLPRRLIPIGIAPDTQKFSELIDSITVKRRGHVRRAKLYYLRERSGRSARIKERLTTNKKNGDVKKAAKKAKPAAAEKAPAEQKSED